MSQPSVLYDALGPRGQRRVLIVSVVSGVLIAGLVTVAMLRLAGEGQLESDRWEPFTEAAILRFIFRGFLTTVRVAIVAGVLAMALGLVLALLRLSGRMAVRAPSRLWVEFFRGFPLLLLIFFLARLFGQYGIDVSAFWILVLGLALYNGATFSEIFRAGILSLPRGQTEAAYSIGLRHGQAMRYVILPQAIRRMVPTLVSQMVTLLKDSSLGFVIPYEELLRRGSIIGEAYPRSLLQSLVVVALLYIALNLALSRLAVWLERRQVRRLGPGAAVEVDLVEVDTGAPADVTRTPLATQSGPR